jgi:hypothetical protein
MLVNVQYPTIVHKQISSKKTKANIKIRNLFPFENSIRLGQYSAFSVALGGKAEPIIKLLLDFGVDYSLSDIYKVVKIGSVTCVVMMLERGLHINTIRNLTKTNIISAPLMTAIMASNVEMVKLLLQHGASVTHCHLLFMEYVVHLVLNDEHAILQLMVDHGWDVSTVLHSTWPSLWAGKTLLTS